MATTLPAFASDVQVLFAQLELCFVANNVMDQRQLPILFSAFPMSLTPVVKDLITDTPLNATYDSIKREVLLQTSLSAEKRFQTLVNDELLGDHMASKLLRRMRELAEDVPADIAIIKQLFFSRLPSQVKAILAPMVEKSSVDVIASSADKVMEFTKGPITTSIPQPKAEVSTLSAVGNTSQVATQVRSHLPRRQYKSRLPSPHHHCHSNKPGLCFYHSRFGAEARRCKRPCSLSNQGNLNLESWARHTLHKIYVKTMPILSWTPGPKHIVWLTQEQLAVSGH